jgi:hypothetical protein
MTHGTKVAFGLMMASMLISAGCMMGGSGGMETELNAKAQASINGMQAQLTGQFRSEAEGQRLTVELDNSNFPTGTAISFCLVTSAATTALAAPPTDAQGVLKFQLDTRSGQMVPAVNMGDTLEARQGVTGSGGADCSAPLLVSAKFQPDVDQPMNH